MTLYYLELTDYLLYVLESRYFFPYRALLSLATCGSILFTSKAPTRPFVNTKVRLEYPKTKHTAYAYLKIDFAKTRGK